MEINNLSEYLNQLQVEKTNNQRRIQEMQEQSDESSSSELAVDSYVPTMSIDLEMPMPSESYNNMGQTLGDEPPMGMPPMGPPPTEDIESTETTEQTSATEEADEESIAVAGSVQSLLDQISETMRVNQDTIESTLDELGLTVTDLYDSENMALLTSTLNDKAEEMGLTTVDDLDSSTSALTSFADSTAESLMSTYSLSSEDFSDLLEAFLEKLEETKSSEDTSTQEA